MSDSGYLVGAYGMFWERDAVEWQPGAGRPWQLLGRHHQNKPQIRLCDFRHAKGFYILWDNYGANYVGLAGSDGGLGARLQAHSKQKLSWTRFSWFAFNPVVDADLEGWAVVDHRDELGALSTDTLLRECESLLITVLGSARPVRHEGGTAVRAQRQMQFLAGQEWTQVTANDFQPGGLGRRVDYKGLVDAWFRQLSDDIE